MEREGELRVAIPLAAKYDPSIAGTGLAVTAHFCCAMLLKQIACLQLQAGNKKAILDRYYPLFSFNYLLRCSKPLSYPILLSIDFHATSQLDTALLLGYF